MDGNKKLYHANKNHPLYSDIHNIILKETGIDRVIENIIHRIGNLVSVYLVGDFAKGKDSEVIDIILVGDCIDCGYLGKKVLQAEEMVGRRVTYRLLEPAEAEIVLASMKPTELLPLWNKGADGLSVKTI
jgi:hypothetical protein